MNDVQNSTAVPPETENSVISTVASAAPKFIGGVVALSAVGYFAGWHEASSYFSAIGAPWATSMISPLAFLQTSAVTVFAVASVFFLTLTLLLDGFVTPKKLSVICIVFLVLSGLALIASTRTFDGVTPPIAQGLAMAGALLIAASAGATLTELVGRVRERGARLSSGYLWLIYWILIPGFMWAPERMGQARAALDMDLTHSSLPFVELNEAAGTGPWRLVRGVDGGILIVWLAEGQRNSKFRVVDAEAIKAIHAVKVSTSTK